MDLGRGLINQRGPTMKSGTSGVGGPMMGMRTVGVGGPEMGEETSGLGYSPMRGVRDVTLMGGGPGGGGGRARIVCQARWRVASRRGHGPGLCRHRAVRLPPAYPVRHSHEIVAPDRRADCGADPRPTWSGIAAGQTKVASAAPPRIPQAKEERQSQVAGEPARDDIL